ncbi:B-type cyclin [Aspergillus melleus]|uniref:B-type cyclin n=1 Tax=Aspergillus melleus TaxID=138277 RepID=UPI001E8E7D49|nr:B-type cyclin [Aspergillus melleus]KAH8429561.1 B-type cyclin [Aspergillus melleus]
MFQNGGTKNAPRRAAFGDVSNTQGSRDDASLAGKKQLKVSEKPSAVIVEKKQAALSQPAQRPKSVSGLRGLLNNASNPKPLEPSTKQLGVSQQTANARKTLNKRGTVFKDPSEPLAEKKTLTSKETKSESNEAKHAPTAPSQLNTREEEVTSKEELEEPLSDELDPSIALSDLPEEEEEEDVSKINDDDCKIQGVRRISKTEESHAAVTNLDRVAKPRDSVEHVTIQSEPEEYWDEEDDENEEDDGYITARSYRSRGDNTTGATTAMLFPRFTQKVKQELARAKQIVEESRTQEDIEEELWDTSMVADYNEDIFDYMKEQEIKMLPNAHYMDNQAEIQWSMRSVLMDWLVQVHHRFGLLPETLFLCVNYIDRFLSCKIVSLGKLQLVGATAIFIAAKYEEINCPSVGEIVYMVDGGYTADEILKAERFMLSMLQFELGWPGPMSFLRKVSKADDYDLETRTLAKYFLEITIMDERFVGSPPSFVAAGAHCLARMMLRKGSWVCSCLAPFLCLEMF